MTSHTTGYSGSMHGGQENYVSPAPIIFLPQIFLPACPLYVIVIKVTVSRSMLASVESKWDCGGQTSVVSKFCFEHRVRICSKWLAALPHG